MPNLHPLPNMLLTEFDLRLDALSLIGTSLRPRCAPAAENLFVHKQLAMYRSTSNDVVFAIVRRPSHKQGET
jgi:hypothetical protein